MSDRGCLSLSELLGVIFQSNLSQFTVICWVVLRYAAEALIPAIPQQPSHLLAYSYSARWPAIAPPLTFRERWPGYSVGRERGKKARAEDPESGKNRARQHRTLASPK